MRAPQVDLDTLGQPQQRRCAVVRLKKGTHLWLMYQRKKRGRQNVFTSKAPSFAQLNAAGIKPATIAHGHRTMWKEGNLAGGYFVDSTRACGENFPLYRSRTWPDLSPTPSLSLSLSHSSILPFPSLRCFFPPFFFPEFFPLPRWERRVFAQEGKSP